MNFIKAIFSSLSRKERLIFVVCLIIFAGSLITRGVIAVYDNSEFVPVRGGEYIEGSVGQPSLINPLISRGSIDKDISSLVYASLYDLTSNIQMENNGRDYIVTLKDNLTWSDGEALTSADVMFTINTIQNPEVNSPLADSWRGVVVNELGDQKLRFSLPSPYVFFENNIKRLPILSQHAFGAVPPSNLRLSSYNLNPISSGPYEVENFKRRKDGFITQYTLNINEEYFGQKPFIEEFQFKFYKNERDLLTAFERRNIDGFGILSPPSEKMYNLPRAQFEEVQTPRYYAVFFNPKATSMLKNKEFRRALKMGVDKERLANEVLGGEVEVVNGPYGAGLGDISDEYTGPNKAEASSTINELKEESEKRLKITITIPDVGFIVETAEFIKKEWESIGVEEVNIERMNMDQFSTTVLRERNYESVIFGNVLENPMDLFPFWHSSERFYPGLNLAFFADDEVDSALEDIRQSTSTAQRKEIFKNTVEQIKSEIPAVFLYSMPYTYIHNGKLHGFKIKEDRFVVPSDRFDNVGSWYVKEARVIE